MERDWNGKGKQSMIPSCEGAERELLLDSPGEEHGVGFGERAVTQRQR